ncbi:MAG: hypothetical protein ACE5H2_09440, partial [Terriglobia bacterium]
GDTQAMQRHAAWATGKPDEGRMLRFQAHAAAFSGELETARERFGRSVEVAQRHNLKELAAFTAILEALTEAEFGNYQQAREGATAALAIARSRYARGLAAHTLALSGAIRQAQALADDLGERFPTDTLVNGVWLPTIRAAIESQRGNPRKAIEWLQAATPYELGLEPGESPGFTAVYVRGQAYLRMGMGGKAAAEFQKILDHRGVDPGSPRYSLAYLGRARAWALAGETSKSRRAYQDFFALWKDADPDIPILLEAKAEYAKLQ